jgi:hypothetical protein
MNKTEIIILVVFILAIVIAIIIFGGFYKRGQALTVAHPPVENHRKDDAVLGNYEFFDF